jgi:DNA repair protein RadA/Sms
MKLKTIYICESCEHTSSNWAGKCPSCDAWNSFIEDVVTKDELKKERSQRAIKAPTATPLSQTSKSFDRTPTGLGEFDRVLGGGIVQGSLILIGGEPGIGKSTLTLQLCANLTQNKNKVLYISGEESVQQIALRAKRLDIQSENLLLLNEVHLESIIASLNDQKPNIVIIDSIQVVSSSEVTGLQGGVSQVRACTEKLMEWAKSTGTPLFIISHVTKGGNLAGPKTLEHLVDTVLTLEGDRYHDLRLLRGVKNRFGSTSEVGIFEMTEIGLTEVPDPSKVFLKNRSENTEGSCLTVTMEGSRPFLVEIQALTNKTHFGYPKRATSGFDLNRLQLLIAVLQKHAGLNLTEQDVYVNVVGGLKLKDPAVDLAVCLAIASSFKKAPIDPKLVAFGELGLSGEIRQAAQPKKRNAEAEKLKLTTLENTKQIKAAIGMLKA